MLFFSYVVHWLTYNYFHLSKKDVREQSLSNLSTKRMFACYQLTKLIYWSLCKRTESVE